MHSLKDDTTQHRPRVFTFIIVQNSYMVQKRDVTVNCAVSHKFSSLAVGVGVHLTIQPFIFH
jgi:hypothetical protein